MNRIIIFTIFSILTIKCHGRVSSPRNAGLETFLSLKMGNYYDSTISDGITIDPLRFDTVRTLHASKTLINISLTMSDVEAWEFSPEFGNRIYNLETHLVEGQMKFEFGSNVHFTGKYTANGTLIPGSKVILAEGSFDIYCYETGYVTTWFKIDENGFITLPPLETGVIMGMNSLPVIQGIYFWDFLTGEMENVPLEIQLEVVNYLGKIASQDLVGLIPAVTKVNLDPYLTKIFSETPLVEIVQITGNHDVINN